MRLPVFQTAPRFDAQLHETTTLCTDFDCVVSYPRCSFYLLFVCKDLKKLVLATGQVESRDKKVSPEKKVDQREEKMSGD